MIVALAMALAVQGAGAPDPPETPPALALARMPKDVVRFVERRFGCNHWSGEEPYDAVRAADIGRALDKLHCDRVEGDEAKLRATYAARPDVLELLDDTADGDGF